MIRGYSVRLAWSQEDEVYVATSPEFLGLVGSAPVAEDALDELREAMEMALEVLAEDGESAPDPRALVEHSGQFRLRLPKSLHALYVRFAEEEGVSLNVMIGSVLANAAGQMQISARIMDDMQFLLSELQATACAVNPPTLDRSGTAAVSLGPDPIAARDEPPAPARRKGRSKKRARNA